MPSERGPGRPRTYTDQTEPLRRAHARLTYWHINVAKRLGAGSISEGIRIALERTAKEAL